MWNPSSSSHQEMVGDTSDGDEQSFASTVHCPRQDAMIQENIDDGTLKEGLSPSRIPSEYGSSDNMD
jgi:hypothetical protein